MLLGAVLRVPRTCPRLLAMVVQVVLLIRVGAGTPCLLSSLFLGAKRLVPTSALLMLTLRIVLTPRASLLQCACASSVTTWRVEGM